MSDIFFGSFGGKARKGRERREHPADDLTVRSKPLPPYIPAAERRRQRLERIRAREQELGLALTPIPPELLEDETALLFAAIRAEVEA